MFSKVVVLSALVAVALSAALPESEPVPIVSQKSDMSPDGSFQWGYESADGTKQEQVGSTKQLGEEVVEVIQGYASWTDPEGGKHELRYTADENGFHPEGSDIPVAPEAGIVRSAAAQAKPKQRSLEPKAVVAQAEPQQKSVEPKPIVAEAEPKVKSVEPVVPVQAAPKENAKN